MPILPVLLLMLAAGATGAASAAPLPRADHPVLGIWRLQLPELGCAEIYHFRGDGTTLVTSAAEVSESEFHIASQPSAKGYYRLDDRVVKDNGKPDCAGQVMQVGTRATNYLRFHPSGALFLMCSDESMNACIGPFERVRGRDT